MAAPVRPFLIDIADHVLDDLRARLRNTRWPDTELVDDWSQGIPLDYVREICRHWADEYDWRERERSLNRFPQFTTEIDGLDIHFVHHRSPHPDAMPLLITHGWPGSFVEFHKVIEPLTDPTRYGGDAADAFHVIAPSLPGFAFSGKPTETGWGVGKVAEVWAQLMERLGYGRYLAQGGDWGSAVTTALAHHDPERCAGIHLTLAMGARPGEPTTPEAELAVERRAYYDRYDSGYARIQMSRPQTIGYGLADSPAAQAAWIIEKFWSWTDCDGHPENVLTRDEMLDNVMLYWTTNSAASSARLYWESFGRRGGGESGPVTIPTGFAVYPREIVPPVREWVEPGFADIVHWSTHDRGGHFAAFEVPDAFVADLRVFASRFR
jgi:pimeloyl-ACP methyl ester carboxylesterase